MEKILLVAVTQEEMLAVVSAFSINQRWERTRFNGKDYLFLGNIGELSIYLAQSEMGTGTPGGALITISSAISSIKPNAIIMVGIAFGSRPDKQRIGDILISKQLSYYEPGKIDNGTFLPRGDRATCSVELLSKFRNGLLDWDGPDVHFGLMLSGEALIKDKTFHNKLKELEPEAIGGDMEGGGLYIAAIQHKIDWIIVKAICDWGDEQKGDTHHRQASENSAKFVYHILKIWGDGRPKSSATGHSSKIEELHKDKISSYTKLQSFDWDDAPEVATFFGRTEQLRTLRRWILKYKCKIVNIIGMRGTGKSSLTLKLCRGNKHHEQTLVSNQDGIAGHFQYAIWRRLVNAPPIGELLSELISHISCQAEVVKNTTTTEKIDILLKYLKKYRCLIVLDNFETILQDGDQSTESYREGYQEYGQFIRAIGTTQHISCLLLNSSEMPHDVSALENKAVRTLELSGVTVEDGIKIFKEVGKFSFNDSDWKLLIEYYNGNPLILKILAKHIREVFGGNISLYIKNKSRMLNDLKSLLEWHYDRLSSHERDVMFWLAINRKPTSYDELLHDVQNSESRHNLSETLQRILRRMPLETTPEAGYRLPPAIMEYITGKFIKTIINDILGRRQDTISTHAILKALSEDFVREAQVRLVANEINLGLMHALGGESEYFSHLKSFVAEIKRSKSFNNYAVGNIINLLACNRKKIDNIDMSQCDISQVYLQDVQLHNINFESSTFSNCSFRQTFGPISSLAISPDSSLMAASESNGTINIWRLEDLQIQSTLRGHTNWIFALEFSPDGNMLASGGEDKTTRIWDIRNESCKFVLREHNNSIWSLAFSPNGELFATGSEDQSIKIWDIENGKCIKTIFQHSQKVFALQFSPDSQRLASASADKSIKLYKIYDWDNPQTILGHDDVVRGISFSADGRYLASCSWDKAIKIWDTHTFSCVNTLHGHSEIIHSVAFSPALGILASSDESGVIRIWDIQHNCCIKTLQNHAGEVWKIAFSKNGNLLISGGYDSALKIWNTNTWICQNTLHGYIDWVQSASISPDKSIIVGAYGDLRFMVWDTEKKTCLKEFSKHTGWTFSTTFNHEGDRFASGSDDRTIKIYNSTTWDVEKVIIGHKAWVQAIAFSPDDNILASGSDDRTIKLWDWQSEREIITFEGHQNGIWSVDFSKDGKLIASGSEDTTVKVWDIHNKECVRTFTGHTDRIHSVKFSPDDKIIASCSDDLSVRLWNIDSGDHVKLSGHKNWVISIAFDPSGRYIASCGKDNTVRIWSLANYECVKVLKDHIGGVWSVAFSSDGSILISASEDGSIISWDVIDFTSRAIYKPIKPYENCNIHAIRGLTEAQIKSLLALGAIDAKNMPTHNYKKFSSDYAKLGLDGTYYLAFRDLPELFKRWVTGNSALDYGCGSGRSTTFLKMHEFNTIGVDISLEMIHEATTKDPNGEYYHINSGLLNFQDESFDLIFSSFVFLEIATIHEFKNILSEMKRVLTKNGCIFLVTSPASEFNRNWVSFLYDFPENTTPKNSGDTLKVQIKNTEVILYDYYWTEFDYRKSIEECGLSLKRLYTPLGNMNDPIQWLDEIKYPYIAIYIIKHA